MMKVLITGGTGFIGMNIAEKLLLEGHHVVLGARKPPLENMTLSLNKHKGKWQFANLDINDQERVGEVLDQYEINHVVHAAVITPGPGREKEESQKILEVNYMGTVCLLEEIKKRSIQKFLYLSSSSVYGDAVSKDGYLYENEEKSYPQPDTLYSISKFAAERTVLRYKSLFELNIVVARVGSVFGPWERYSGVRDTLSGPFSATRLAVLGESAVLEREGERDWVYSRDVANATYQLLKNSDYSYDVYNLSSGYVWTIADWCEKLEKHFPDFSYRITVEENNNDHLITLHGAEDPKPLNIERLITDVGYKPKYNLENSFNDYMKWIINNKKLFYNKFLDYSENLKRST